MNGYHVFAVKIVFSVFALFVSANVLLSSHLEVGFAKDIEVDSAGRLLVSPVFRATPYRFNAL